MCSIASRRYVAAAPADDQSKLDLPVDLRGHFRVEADLVVRSNDAGRGLAEEDRLLGRRGLVRRARRLGDVRLVVETQRDQILPRLERCLELDVDERKRSRGGGGQHIQPPRQIRGFKQLANGERRLIELARVRDMIADDDAP